MKYLIAGLGNIGPEYDDTRHNIGFAITDALASRAGASFAFDKYAYVSQFSHKGRQLTLVKPTTYMNLSGKAMQYWMQALKIPAEQTLVLVDDLALPFGRLRLRASGSSAGHNGLKHIEETLGHQNYPRLRFGIGSNYPKGRQVDYVLGKFSLEEQKELDMYIEQAADLVQDFCTMGLVHAMNAYNRQQTKN
jgi:PTH1 family peptidyl-tRNA hydrolase